MQIFSTHTNFNNTSSYITPSCIQEGARGWSNSCGQQGAREWPYKAAPPLSMTFMSSKNLLLFFILPVFLLTLGYGNNKTAMAKFRILSIDGGGLRGIIPIKILQHIESLTGVQTFDMFDMIVGTSTGGLIACALTASADGKRPKYTTADLEQLYIKDGKTIFPPGNIIQEVRALMGPKYSPNGLQTVLTNLLDGLKVSDCLKPIFVPSYDILNNEAIFFKSRHLKTNPLENVSLVDVCRATSAAPTYLPAYQFSFGGKQRVCVDGGVFMNNPSVGAIVELSKYGSDYYNYDSKAFPADLYVLSLGTGHYTEDLANKKYEEGGELNWAAEISDVMMQGVNTTTCYEADELLDDGNFLRLTIQIDDAKYADMADSSDETRNYLIGEVAKLWTDQTVNTSLQAFINKAELNRGGAPLAKV